MARGGVSRYKRDPLTTERKLMATKRVSLLLADDHRIVLDGLRQILEPDFEILGMLGNGRELVKAAAKLKPDVIVADISMPLLNGIDATRKLLERDPDVKIIILTMHPELAYACEAFEAGASGCVIKTSAGDELMQAIETVVRGHRYVTPLIAEDMLDVLLQRRARPERRGAELTARQREVVQLIAEGHTAREIAEILNLSPKTVEYHKYRVIELLQLDSVADLKQYALDHHIESGLS